METCGPVLFVRAYKQLAFKRLYCYTGVGSNLKMALHVERFLARMKLKIRTVLNRLLPVLVMVIAIACTGHAEELIFWNFWDPKFVLPVIEKFERENPGIKIRNEQINWGNGLDKIVVALANGMAPDICELGSTWVGKFTAGEALIDITDKVADLKPSYHMWEPATLNGRVYGLPWLVSTRVLFYNRELFRSVGLNPDLPPLTWQELLEAARKIHDPERGLYGFGMNAGEAHVLYKKFMPFAWGNGGAIIDSAGNFVFDSPANREALHFYLQLKQFSYCEKQDLLDEAFKAGKLGLTISGSWNFADFPRNAPDLDFGVCLMPRPGVDKGYSASFLGGQVLVLFKNCRNPDAAAKFIRMLTAPENTLPLTREALVSFPAHKEAYSDVLFNDPRLAIFVEQMKTAVHPPVYPAWIEVEKILNSTIEKAMYGEPVDRLFADAVARFNEAAVSRQAVPRLVSPEVSEAVYNVNAALLFFLLALLGCGTLISVFTVYYAKNSKARSSSDVQSPVEKSQRLLLFMSPWLVTFVVFWLYPLAFSLVLSFFSYDVFQPALSSFAGFKNYLRLLHDHEFRQALFNTLLFVAGTTPFTTVLALVLALMINSVRCGSSIFRSIFFLPSIVSIVVTATVFKSFYSPVGMLNRLIGLFGISGQAWLVEKGLALPAVMLMTVWAWTGYYMVLYLAALKAVPRQLYEAAEIDGADEWQQFRYITLPQIRYMTIFVLVVNTIRSWQVFPEIFTLTRGGPVGSTNTLVHYLYEAAFRYHEMGYAAAVSFVLLLIILLFSVLQMRLLKGAARW